ncbi:tRNA (cytosine(38)-C(5))-methyltransferase [Sabethes cyaneus]|uniref:tRNA (cytosine(38)-C(5))-methyltransferase n=1 Tax=Sabethes cyaneus TaxID=53552 RepID=UPI00237DA41F|nr:tRNA (cytosine(38)-C(5))-methyltransferase [Sabethes cyaneus]
MDNSEIPQISCEQLKRHRGLELFSGIGGMHYALRQSGKTFEVVEAIDINPLANQIYNHNFGRGKAKNKNILGLTSDAVRQMDVNVVLMSPPCQPFSRNGNFGDVADHRSDPFVHICGLLEHMSSVQFILLENVKGFERSKACELYKTKLVAAGFNYREYILSPHAFGVPNTRHRYYCVAKRGHFRSASQNQIITEPTKEHIQMARMLNELVEDDSPQLDKYLLKDDILQKRLAIMDICTPDSSNSMCFTKAYTHYAEGTGSVYSPLPRAQFDTIYRQMLMSVDEEERRTLRSQLRLRYFTPKEVAKLMCFPDDFRFPPETTDRQCYRVLGNSINVLVVSSLLDELE